MKKLQFLAVIFFLISALSCADKELRPYEKSLVGTWRLFEAAGSTGARWYVDSIPAVPLQSLTFTRNGKVSGQGDALSNFNYPRYRILSENEQVKLELYGKDTDKDGFTSLLRLEGDTLYIAPPCREGCQYGFVKIR